VPSLLTRSWSGRQNAEHRIAHSVAQKAVTVVSKWDTSRLLSLIHCYFVAKFALYK